MQLGPGTTSLACARLIVPLASFNVARQECEEGVFKRGELPGRFTAKKLFGWLDKRYDKEYWERLDRN